jgi:hypothetical protein
MKPKKVERKLVRLLARQPKARLEGILLTLLNTLRTMDQRKKEQAKILALVPQQKQKTRKRGTKK